MEDAVDKSTLRRFRAGAPEAYRILFERYAEEVRGVIRARLPPALLRRVGVSDVVQETQFAAFQSRDGFSGESAEGFRRWLLGIAEHKVIDAIRRHQEADGRSLHREERAVDTTAEALIAGSGPTPSEVAVAGELAEIAVTARMRLPKSHQEVLRLTREEGLTIAEAAARTGRSAEATKKLYGRAILRFKEEFDRLKGSDRDG